MRLYINYRLKRIVTGVWANQSGAILDRLAALCPKDPMYKLMKVQTLLTNRQRQDALWILDQFKREYTKRTTSVWGYYLYLTTLIEREPSYVDSVTEEIEQIFHRRPDSARLFWITLFLKEDYYRNPAARFAAIKQWMKKDKSPYFYLEAYYMLWQEPYILTKLDRFEIEVLNWAVKWGALTKDIAKQVMDLIPAKKECDRFLYRILEACYQVNPTDEMLAVICSCLIRSQCFGREYHKWYELGIKYKLRMTGLYEAYLTSLDSRTFTEVPKMIQMYFQYDSGLAYQQKAVLYANIIAAEDTQSEVYQKYRSTMEDFCMQQIAEGHINDNLALIYKKLLPAELPDRETAQKLSAVLFTHRFHCTDRRAAKLFVLERWKDKPQEIFVKGGTAYFTAVTKNYCLIIEDAYGNRYGKSVEYCDEALMNPDRYIKSARALAGDELIYQIYDLDQKMASGRFLPGDIRSVQNLMESDAVSDRFKEELTLKMIDCCKEEKVGSGILEVCSGNFSREAERVLLDYLVEEQWYDRAYALAEECGYDYLKEKHLTALCSYAIEHAEFEEDDFLTGFAETAFVRGAYNDVILKYLSRCYSGATKTMAKLWEAAHEAASIDTTDLEERIITQMLYSTDYIAQIDQIFEHYAAVGSKEICMAYLSYFADAYLFLDMVVPDHVFLRIWKYYRAGTPLNDACKIGLMKYFAVKDGLTGPEYDTADELLYLYTGRNLWFSFYSSFEKRLRVKYHLYDKFFVSYHARGAQRIRIRYSMDGENYREETMTEMYHGIYVKQFVLFFGESVQYYITEESSGQEKVTESASLKPRNPAEKDGRGRYGKLNEILTVRALDEPETLEQKMKQYYRMEKMTEELFQLL